MATTEEQIKLILKDGLGEFVKFTNTKDFPQLDASTRDFLKNYGVYSYAYAYPPLITSGVLKKFNEHLIQIGEGGYNREPFCIDTDTNQFVGVDIDNNKINVDIINSSIQKYIETLYVSSKYTEEIRGPESLGKYWENHKKYAAKLQEMLETVEPNIMEYLAWANPIEEMELGVI